MTTQTNIVQIVADGRPGGGTTMVLGLVDGLRAAVEFTTTIVSQPASYLESEARTRGIEFVGIDFFTSLLDFRLASRLRVLLGARRFALAHLHGLRAAHHSVQLPLRQSLGRLVYTVHGLHQLHMPAPLRWAANVAERRVMRRVDARVFVSRADQLAAAEARLTPSGCETRMIHNGVDLSALAASAKSERSIDVAFVGRLDVPKGPQAAARVLAQLAMRGRRCVLAGDGPLRAACEAELAGLPGGSQVVRVGELTLTESWALIAEARVLVMPSLWEGLPLLPMEAMALGVPLVATRLPGIAEVVEDGGTGLLTPPGDEPAMVAAVDSLLSDEPRWRRFKAAGRARVQAHFDRAACTDAYRHLYRDLLGAPGLRTAST